VDMLEALSGSAVQFHRSGKPESSRYKLSPGPRIDHADP